MIQLTAVRRNQSMMHVYAHLSEMVIRLEGLSGEPRELKLFNLELTTYPKELVQAAGKILVGRAPNNEADFTFNTKQGFEVKGKFSVRPEDTYWINLTLTVASDSILIILRMEEFRKLLGILQRYFDHNAKQEFPRTDLWGWEIQPKQIADSGTTCIYRLVKTK